MGSDRSQLSQDRRTPVTPDPRAVYPHFGRGDAEVWEAWLRIHRDEILEVYYDVALGGVIVEDPTVDQAMRDAWQYDTAVKIDAVAVTAIENLVCEVKPTARLGAIGQALGYALLLDDDPLNEKPNTPVIIAAMVTAEVRRVADTLGCRIDIV